MQKMIKTLLVFMSLLMAVGILWPPVSATATQSGIVQLSIEGVIGPATDDYIQRSFEKATLDHAELVVIVMDTPGGLDTSMRGIIKNITTTSLPVVTYVSPTGARAASAGTYILYASHIAAMAPGTNLGAATPVQIGGLSPPESKEKPEKDAEKKAPAINTDAMKRKAINDAAAYIRGLAQLRGRNQEWAEKAVREAASLSATEALELRVINLVATDMVDLLQQLNGMEIEVLGHKRTLKTEGLTIIEMAPDWRSRLLSVITNPNIAYILMLVGIYGLIFEFSNPGSIVPGTIGAICLLLAMYSFQLLPINYAGMALILLGIALMVGEAFQPSFGVLGIGGAVAFVIGSIILIDTEAPGFGINLSIIITFALISILVFVFVIGMAIRARRRPVVSGQEELIGAHGVVINDFDDTGHVTVHSETWNARTHLPLQKGQSVKVTGMQGLVLEVEPLVPTTEESEQ